MRRAVYCGLLRLHPASFEEQFAEEMLWIFDLKRSSESGVALLVDCLVSLCRQWAGRQPVWTFGMGLLLHLILAACSAICYLNSPAKG